MLFFDREIGNPASIFGVFPAIAATEQILYQNAGSPTHKKCSVHGTYDDTISKLGGIIFFSVFNNPVMCIALKVHASQW